MLAASTMEGSRTTLDETVMPPPSTPRGVKRKTLDKESTLPVSTCHLKIYFLLPCLCQNIVEWRLHILSSSLLVEVNRNFTKSDVHLKGLNETIVYFIVYIELHCCI